MATIRNPIEWVYDVLRDAAVHTTAIVRAVAIGESDAPVELPKINRIGTPEIKDALYKGLGDFQASRTDVLVLSVVYPVVGLMLWWLASNYNMLPLLVPLLGGFALLGPVAAVGMYEISRQRETGREVNWASAFDVVKSPSFGSIIVLGLALIVVFLFWLGTARYIYTAFLGTVPPRSASAMLDQVLFTSAGRAMALVGAAVGSLFAALVLTCSAISFPMLVDRNVGPVTAMVTSVRAIIANPVPMATWGLIVSGGLFLGAIPFLLGLIVVVPIFGHATWHLYRKLVV